MKTNNFKPNCQYQFSDSDCKFIIQLAKIGEVHLLSKQVRLTSYNNENLAFLDYGDGNGSLACLGMTLPDGWIIEGVHVNKFGFPVVIFGVNRDE